MQLQLFLEPRACVTAYVALYGTIQIIMLVTVRSVQSRFNLGLVKSRFTRKCYRICFQRIQRLSHFWWIFLKFYYNSSMEHYVLLISGLFNYKQQVLLITSAIIIKQCGEQVRHRVTWAEPLNHYLRISSAL